MLEASFDVQALAIGFRKYPRGGDVHGHAQSRDHRHEAAGHVWRVDKP
jgi:hypothetical protein